MTLMHANLKCLMMVTEEARHQIEFSALQMKWAIADILTRTPIVTNSRLQHLWTKRVEGIEITSSKW
ncbi:MAG: hypothetical protein U0V02_06060 [Anaerolineales bacterium]